jgi:hypothetical protein
LAIAHSLFSYKYIGTYKNTALMTAFYKIFVPTAIPFPTFLAFFFSKFQNFSELHNIYL